MALLLTDKHMVKMSEHNILGEYSMYLQNIAITAKRAGVGFDNVHDIIPGSYLSYEEFKEYYILNLVGNSDYLGRLIHNLQQKTGADGLI